MFSFRPLFWTAGVDLHLMLLIYFSTPVAPENPTKNLHLDLGWRSFTRAFTLSLDERANGLPAPSLPVSVPWQTVLFSRLPARLMDQLWLNRFPVFF